MTKNILVVHSSLNGWRSVSSALARSFVDQLAAQGAVRVKHRDLAVDMLPHLDAAAMAAWQVDSEQRDAEQQILTDRSDRLIAELEWADLLVVTAPMYNFAAPSTLKAWVDQVVRARRTFRYIDGRAVGAMQSLQSVVITTRGGFHRDTPNDNVVPWLSTVLPFIGIEPAATIYAEGLATEKAGDSTQQAESELADLATQMMNGGFENVAA